MSLINIKKTISIMALVALTGSQCHAALGANQGGLPAVRRLPVPAMRQNPAIVPARPATIHEQFRQAAMEGNTELTRELLERGADLRSTDTAGRTALNLAVERDHADTIEFLLSRGAGYQPKSLQVLAARAANRKLKEDVQAAGETTVSQARLDDANLSQTGILLCFMEDRIQRANGNPNGALIATIRYPSSSLFKNYSPEAIQSIQKESRDIARQILIEYKDELNTQVYTQALENAAEIGDPLMVSLLLNTQAYITDYTLEHAVKGGHTEIVKILLNTIKEKYRSALSAARETITEDKLQAEVTQRINNATSSRSDFLDKLLIIAAKNGYPDIVHILLDAKININQTNLIGQTALMNAIQEQHDEIISILLDAGADVFAITGGGDSALSYAAGNGNTKRVNQLLSILLTSIEQNDFLRLHYCNVISAAIEGNHIEIIYLLLQAVKESPEINHIMHQTFHNVFEFGTIETAHLFLNDEIERKSCPRSGLTSHSCLVNREYAAAVSQLCKNAGLNITGDAGSAALLYACEQQKVAIVLLLLDAGAQLGGYTDDTGNTALMCVVQEARYGTSLKLVQILLAAGASDPEYINAINEDQDSALAAAVREAILLQRETEETSNNIKELQRQEEQLKVESPNNEKYKKTLIDTKKEHIEYVENIGLRLKEQLLVINELLHAGAIIDDNVTFSIQFLEADHTIKTYIQDLELDFDQYFH